MPYSATGIGLFFLTVVVFNYAGASHFRGMNIQWRPVDQENFDGQVIY